MMKEKLMEPFADANHLILLKTLFSKKNPFIYICHLNYNYFYMKGWSCRNLFLYERNSGDSTPKMLSRKVCLEVRFMKKSLVPTPLPTRSKPREITKMNLKQLHKAMLLSSLLTSSTKETCEILGFLIKNYGKQILILFPSYMSIPLIERPLKGPTKIKAVF